MLYARLSSCLGLPCPTLELGIGELNRMPELCVLSTLWAPGGLPPPLKQRGATYNADKSERVSSSHQF